MKMPTIDEIEEYDTMCYWIGSYVFSSLSEGIKSCVNGNIEIFKYILGRYIIDPEFSRNGVEMEDIKEEVEDAFIIPPHSP